MSRQTLRDRANRILGYIDTTADGKQVARDAKNSIKGYFDPKSNVTRDAKLRVVGKGNLLASLITRAD